MFHKFKNSFVVRQLIMKISSIATILKTKTSIYEKTFLSLHKPINYDFTYLYDAFGLYYLVTEGLEQRFQFLSFFYMY